MSYEIKKAAVLGAGVMGATIAAHLANAGIETLLLDIVPFELTMKTRRRGTRKKALSGATALLQRAWMAH